ncbi:MAG: hypothetical protein CMM74_11540 [Rhodospirillaceae bacterium]|jgi:hypothetical protein|nr:hypothetical protein [Rhodospirillaceae bacterium]|tara:strand:- start:976 stop:1158 length:183 start_codon:yes stop_codon:yes gene_type:complete
MVNRLNFNRAFGYQCGAGAESLYRQFLFDEKIRWKGKYLIKETAESFANTLIMYPSKAIN